MQKILKSKLFFFILGVLIPFGICTVFAYTYSASNIGFTSTELDWNADNCSSALDDLYTNSSNCVTKNEFFDSFKYVKSTPLLAANRNGNSMTFTVDSGRNIIVLEMRCVEYSTDFSLTGSDKLVKVGDTLNSRTNGISSSSDHFTMLINGRGGYFIAIYKLDITEPVTLTFSINNTVPSNDTANYISVGKASVYKYDYQ